MDQDMPENSDTPPARSGKAAEPAPQKQPKKRGLGRGLNALFGDDEAEFGHAEPDEPGTSEISGSTALVVTAANALTVQESAPPPEPLDPNYQHWSQRDFRPETSIYSSQANLSDDARAQNADYASPVGGRRLLSVAQLLPGVYQPRQNFDDGALEELAQSIREHGLIQPIVVRPIPGRPDDYEIVAGERRWRAAQRALLHEVPVIIRDLDDRATMELALIENLQRQDLSPLEEAQALQRLIDDYEYTQEKAGLRVGKSRSYVANILRLLDLDIKVRNLLMDGKITAGHARAMLPLSPELQQECAKKVIALNLNVRQTERLVGDSLGRDPMPRNVGKLEVPIPPPMPTSPRYPSDIPARYLPDQDTGGRGRHRSNERSYQRPSERPSGRPSERGYDNEPGYSDYDEDYDELSPADYSMDGSALGSSKDVSTLALEREVSNLLGTKVTIDLSTQQSGVIKISYDTLDQLDDVLHRLSHNPGRLAIKG